MEEQIRVAFKDGVVIGLCIGVVLGAAFCGILIAMIK